MRVVVKILILLVAVILAVGGIMIYAKTKVEPPVALETVDQFADDLEKSNLAIIQGEDIVEINYNYSSAIEKINIFQLENKIDPTTADISLENVAASFASLFMQFCYEEFEWASCGSENHEWMLYRIQELNNHRRTDGAKVLHNSTSDSLEHVSEIIANYKQAYIISRKNTFTNLSDARTTINQAERYANDRYLSNCSDLVSALNSVKGNIAKSHYDYASSQVDELSRYSYLSKDFYEDKLVPHVNSVLYEYKEAVALYGSNEDYDALLSSGQTYYDRAMSYYQLNRYD